MRYVDLSPENLYTLSYGDVKKRNGIISIEGEEFKLKLYARSVMPLNPVCSSNDQGSNLREK